MRRKPTPRPPADRAFDEMTNDGCPLTPDRARTGDDRRPCDAGESDMYEGESADPAALAAQRGP